MTPERCKRCNQFMPRYGQHRCPCDSWEHRRDRSARHRYATALALSLFVGGFGLLYVGTLPEAGLPIQPPASLAFISPTPEASYESAVALPAAATLTLLSPPVDEPIVTSMPASSPPDTATGASANPPLTSEDLALVLAGGTTRQGTIAYAKPEYGPTYLATPEPRGTWIVICGVRACTEPVQTNDVGPELWLQRRGRIVDVSSVVFEAICGELRFGLCPGSYEVIAGPRVTPPATESEGMP